MPQLVGDGKVVVNARDGLHQTTVAIAQAAPVDGLSLGNIGPPILTQGNLIMVRGQNTGHAAWPQQFITQMTLDEDVHILEFLQDRLGTGVNTSNKLELGL